ncbi:helix-turn-helix domain-containing protein [Paenibacillus oceani]|uniref:AraC family transcriptional regulator n=1 Tax=Paenibacillus oceani TaxID=2772510 RepID=A0A927H1Z5_9BACL|nr:AraC family transcriptional regulator [Paenibacillus oceani]MBD2865711.1 AraC family transcriptional regulator [Paenibacillus oceani]
MPPVEKDFDFVVTDIRYVVHKQTEPAWKVEYANEDWYILALSTGGKAHYRIRGEQYLIKKGDVLFFPKNLWHSGESDVDDPWSYYSLIFKIVITDSAYQDKLMEIRPVVKNNLLFQSAPLFQALHNEWVEKRAGYLIKCRSQVMDILSMLIRESASEEDISPQVYIIDQIVHYMIANSQRFYSVDELSQLAKLSQSHFRLLFKKVTGMSIIQYQNKLKINIAMDLLVSGKSNVTEVALRLGFNDIYYFSRLFKKKTGQSPSEYVKRNK